MPSEGRSGARGRPRGILRAAVVAIVVTCGASGVVPVVRGAALACGSSITTNIKLTQDVGPCSGPGLIVTADDVTLNLNGHHVFGTLAAGEGIGVLVTSATGVTVMGGTVSGFDAGVVVSGGTGNRVERVKAIANIGQSGVSTFGDGIVVSGSSANTITGNEVRSNGPFSGISVLGSASSGNKISKNLVQNNDVPVAADEQNDVGIRLEPGTSSTTVRENVISFNGLDGLVVFQTSVNNVIEGNSIKANGFHDKGHRKGDGIRVFGVEGADTNTLRQNTSSDNAANGIVLAVGATGNTLRRNKATRNGIGEPGAVDLADLNPGCDANIWLKNAFRTRNQNCIT